jgi:hypothetical protein
MSAFLYRLIDDKITPSHYVITLLNLVQLDHQKQLISQPIELFANIINIENIIVIRDYVFLCM